MKNILIVRNQDQGRYLIEALGGDYMDWHVIGYLGALLSHKADLVVVVRPALNMFSPIEAETIDRWFKEAVPHITARAKKVLEIG